MKPLTYDRHKLGYYADKRQYGPWGESILHKGLSLYKLFRLLRHHGKGYFSGRIYIKGERFEVFKWLNPDEPPDPRAISALMAERKRNMPLKQFTAIMRNWISLGTFESENEALELIEDEVEIMKAHAINHEGHEGQEEG